MRTFIAIELPEEVKEYLRRLQGKLKESGADVKWAAPRNIHLTLKFLGEVDENKTQEIAVLIEKTAKTTRSFVIHLSVLGGFPAINSPRIIWIGIDKGDIEVKDIAKNLEESLEAIGIPAEDRKFHSHITIGRTRSSLNRTSLAKTLNELKNSPQAENIEFPVRKITLFKSTLTPKGPIYEIIKESFLGTGTLLP
ncbi:MAG: RNA 2',3'-cyclic phosphodiesterase [Candidatus Omnitrophica bacterium]|nr:RNA 2',3'-cyclic phosphodiesterase [Candidatus Omnitrophota bacterium]